MATYWIGTSGYSYKQWKGRFYPEALPDTEPRVLQIRALVLGTAMDWLADNTASTNHILGFPFTEHGLQLGVESSLRSLARVAPTQAHRYALVDLANSVRPTSTF